MSYDIYYWGLIPFAFGQGFLYGQQVSKDKLKINTVTIELGKPVSKPETNTMATVGMASY